MGAGRARDRRAAVGIPGAERGHPARRVRESRFRHRAAAGQSGRPRRCLQRPFRREGERQLVELRARLPAIRGTNTEPQGVTGRCFQTTSKPRNAVFNLLGMLGDGAINELKIGYNAAASTEQGLAPAGLREHHPEPQRVGRQHRHRRTGRLIGRRHSRRPGARQQRGQRPVGALQPVLADGRRHVEPGVAAATT